MFHTKEFGSHWQKRIICKLKAGHNYHDLHWHIPKLSTICHHVCLLSYLHVRWLMNDFFYCHLFAQCWMTTFRSCDCFILSMYGCYTQATACNNQLVTSIVVTRLWNGCYNLLSQPCGQVMKALWQGCINLFLSMWVGVFSGIPDNVVGFGWGFCCCRCCCSWGGGWWLDQ